MSKPEPPLTDAEIRGLRVLLAKATRDDWVNVLPIPCGTGMLNTPRCVGSAVYGPDRCTCGPHRGER